MQKEDRKPFRPFSINQNLHFL